MNKNRMTVLAWTASVMLVACMMLVSCKENKPSVENIPDEEETEEAEGPELPDLSEDDVVEVSTAREFLLALKSETHIKVTTSKRLNLTEALDDLIEEGRIERYNSDAASGLYWESEYDGNTLFIVKKHDIIIEGVDDDGADLMVTPSYADVLHFERCSNIVIKNVTMGHKVTGGCVGDVLVLNRSKNFVVDNCNLYGCGVNGLSTLRSSDIALHGTNIYGCSFRAVVLQATKDVSFDKCKIYDNGYGIFVDEDCGNICFEKSKLYDNRGELFSCYVKTVLKNCQVEHHHDDNTHNVKMVNCEVEMDYDEAESLPDIEEY